MLKKMLPTKEQPLLLGFANSMFQASGTACGKSNWTAAIDAKTVPDVGQSINHWNLFEADLDRMAAMGANSYRISIEWSQIEAEQGKYNELVIADYIKKFLACKKRGIEPVVTLFHFTQPEWFTKLGGFEKEENIKYFVHFCETIFTQLNKYVRIWCTINEPAIFAFSGYLLGQFPPHRHDLQQTVDVLTHLLKAHTIVYQTLKKMPGGDSADIGIVHNILRFVPRYKYEPVELMLTKFLTTITNNLVMNYLKEGKIDYSFCCRQKKLYEDADVVNSYDFIGLNFYANPVIGFNTKNFFGATCFPGQILSDMQLPIDPHGFSLAIDEIAQLKKPIYITEAGIADAKDDKREKFLKEYLHVFNQKRRAGVDLRGFFHWTFADNYEWNLAYTQKFGLFDGQRVKRGSAKIFEDFMRASLSKESDSSKAVVPACF